MLESDAANGSINIMINFMVVEKIAQPVRCPGAHGPGG